MAEPITHDRVCETFEHTGLECTGLTMPRASA
jgi:hypothetical protein